LKSRAPRAATVKSRLSGLRAKGGLRIVDRGLTVGFG
jgi:hypothetical protein